MLTGASSIVGRKLSGKKKECKDANGIADFPLLLAVGSLVMP